MFKGNGDMLTDTTEIINMYINYVIVCVCTMYNSYVP